MAELDLAAYLTRLGLDDPGPPSVAALAALHRAQVERVPYETLEIHLGRPTTVDPYESARRVLRGRGGYCYHLNGAFSTLLGELGYDVRWHLAGVQRRDEPAPGANGNHLALTVHGLPAPECPDGVWLVDAGLGDGPHEPLPLRPGRFRQGPFTYQVVRSPVVCGGWRFVHDPAGSFAAMDFAMATATPRDFAAMHQHLSTSPSSPFLRTVTVQRRDRTGVDVLRGCLLSRVDGVTERTELETAADWYAALVDLFGLRLDDVGADAKDTLWSRVRSAHEAWLARREAAR